MILFLGQLWTDDRTNQIKSRENSWNNHQNFNLTLVNKKLTTGTNIMAIIGTSVKPVAKLSTNANDKSQDDKTQLWKKGPTKTFLPNGKEYFTITNLYDRKVLTAVEGPPASLEIKGKPKQTHYSSCQIVCRLLLKSPL